MNDKRISKDSYADSPYEIVMMIYSETLVAVKSDLAEKPAETERNTTPAKYWGIGAFLWKLYEKTLKVIVDAVMEKMWPK